MSLEASRTDPFSATQRMLAQAGATLMFIGLLTGGYAAAAITGQLSVDAHTALAAHLSALLGSFFIFSVGWTLPMLRYGPMGQRRLAWAVVIPNFANWFVTSVKAALHVAGVGVNENVTNNVVFGVLDVVVVIPILVAAFMWMIGFSKGAPSTK